MIQNCSAPPPIPRLSFPKKKIGIISSLSDFEIQKLAMPQLPSIKSNDSDERDFEQDLNDQRLKSYKILAQRRNTRFENIREFDEEEFQTEVELSCMVSPVVVIRPRPIRIRQDEEGYELLFLPDWMQ